MYFCIIMHHCIRHASCHIILMLIAIDQLCKLSVSFSFWVFLITAPNHTTNHTVLPAALFLCLVVLVLHLASLQNVAAFVEISALLWWCANQHFLSASARRPKFQSRLVFLCNFSQSECMIFNSILISETPF